MIKDFLPISKDDMEKRGWDSLDFVYVIGDAYVDHPSFGHAIISRVLEAAGYKVGFISQPDWKKKESVMTLGKPRLSFLVMTGNMDSMVNHYSVSKKKRQTDSFTPGGVMGKRPDYAATVYCNLIRKAYGDVPIMLGGIEASLRRLAHYDYWSDSVKRSVLLDSDADLLLYGMGEKTIVEVADALNSGIDIKDLTYIDGTVYKTTKPDEVFEAEKLPTYNEIKTNKKKYAESFYTQSINTDPFNGKRLIECYPDNNVCVVVNPPSKPLTQAEMDRVYSYPYMRNYHPTYEEAGGIPAIEEVKFSIISNRGCFGNCNFCALAFHQGRIVQARGQESIVNEASKFILEKDFKGYIHDVGGPTANFRNASCDKQMTKGSCKDRQCLFPAPCKNLKVTHIEYLKTLRKLRELPGVKKVFIRSGIRFDYLMADKDDTFFNELVEHHISGQLKVAPEHISKNVLDKMGKPESSVYLKFAEKYKRINQKKNKNQFLVPYFMSSHPGSTLKEAIELAEYLRDIGYTPQQVQDFYPTPGSLSTCMYYTGLDPRTMESVYVPTNPHEKAMQRALIQFRLPNNYRLVLEALKLAHREDLIGFDKRCLIRPAKGSEQGRRFDAAKKPYLGKRKKPAEVKKKTLRKTHSKKK